MTPALSGLVPLEVAVNLGVLLQVNDVTHTSVVASTTCAQRIAYVHSLCSVHSVYVRARCVHLCTWSTCARVLHVCTVCPYMGSTQHLHVCTVYTARSVHTCA